MDPLNLRRNHLSEYRKVLTDEQCQDIIATMKAKITQFKNDPGDDTDIKFNDDDNRQDWNIFAQHYQSFDDITKLIRARVKSGWDNYLQCYLEDYDPYDSATSKHRGKHIEESVKLQWSPPGGGFTGWHSEQGSSLASMPRYAVWMIYLNSIDKKDGGSTQFRHLTDKHGEQLGIQPEAGTLLIWPAAYTHEHRSAPDLKTDKFIATGWFTYDPDRNLQLKPVLVKK